MTTSTKHEQLRRAGLTAASILLSLTSLSASAEERDPALTHATDAHIEAISSAPLETLMPQYAKNARLEWIGGPLDGKYEGAAAIENAWSRFIAARGDMQAEIQGYTIAENPKGRTVIATVLYRGTKTIPVRIITAYRDGMIATEIWQIDPAISK